ncbi:MAG: queuosine precursor transporter [Gammaproteobacteria bacterium]|jgi:uncharacterized PurR-regulated membrane protein YhhQ (DUF165 family)|nr:queuosine precursor transporter [Gammaproteobacteria bacterium]
MNSKPSIQVSLWPYLAAMVVVVVVSANVLVQYPINDWLTWGAITYPLAFLLTDLCNRRFGPAHARRLVWLGFVMAVLLSALLATPRIAVASGSAFLLAQMLDVKLFDHWRDAGKWWLPPLLSSSLGSALDTAWFFSLAFAGTGLPWLTWALGDYLVKLIIALLLLLPYRNISRRFRDQAA